MPKQNKNTLKNYFADGARPAAEHFVDLIDSTINLQDDGFDKTDREGLKITNAENYDSLMSFYNEEDITRAAWQLKFNSEDGNLVWSGQSPNGDNSATGDEVNEGKLKNALNLSRTGNELRVGIGTNRPEDTFDVNGGIRSLDRRGHFGKSFSSVLANGDWQAITGELTGGSVFEVVARAKKEGTQRYALMHAIAMHAPWSKRGDILTFLGLKNRIRYTHVYYDLYIHKLKLHWKQTANGYQLEIKSNCKYGDGGVIDFHITRLWSDEDEFYWSDDDVSELGI